MDLRPWLLSVMDILGSAWLGMAEKMGEDNAKRYSYRSSLRN